MPLPTAVPRCSVKRSIAAMQVVAILGGRLHDGRGAGERHDADAHVVRLVGDESARRFLRCGQPVGLDVDGAHAARHVHCEDDRLVLRRQRDHGGGARDRDEHQRQRDQEQERRHVPAQAGCPRPSRRGSSRGSRNGRASRCLRRSSSRYTPTTTGTSTSSHRSSGQRNVMARPEGSRQHGRPRVRRLRRLRRSANRRIASARSSSVRSSSASTPACAECRAQRLFAVLGRARRSACGSRGRGCRRTTARRSPRPASSAGRDRAARSPADRTAARRALRGAARAGRAASAQPGRADEIGDDEHDRAPRDRRERRRGGIR